VRRYDIASGMRVGIKLKKAVKEGDLKQNVLQLIAANCLFKFIILTVLKEECLFYWITNGGIQECSLGLQNGIALIDDMLAGTEYGSYLNRWGCWFGAYFSITKSGCHEWLPHPDIGDMGDFFTVQTPAFNSTWQYLCVGVR